VVSYAIPDWHDFLTPVYVIAAPLVGCGALGLWELLQPQARALLLRGRTLAGHAYPTALIALGALSLALSVYTYLPQVNQSDDTAYMRHSQALLAIADHDAWVIMPRPSSPSFYYSWGVRYTAFANGTHARLTMVAPPEVDPPPGPAPAYARWADVADDLNPQALIDSGRQVLVLDWADDRFAGWGLVAVCAPGSSAELAGYEVAAVMVGDEIIPLVDAARWAQIRDYVVFSGSAFACPPG
jgi:hypothetical protein